MFQFTQTIPLSLYVHIPWCVQKCPYCDFNSHKAPEDLQEKRYIDALLADLEQHLPDIWGRRISSVFIGGGTPSLFSAESIADLLSGLHSRLAIMPSTEITLEANPGTVDENRFAGFFEAGINRLSLGLQSMQDDKLKALGRIHTAEQSKSAILAAQKAGFTNINLDLMHGLPQQTVEDAVYDIETALSFKPTHLSWYQLTIEPNTLFHHKPPTLPAENILENLTDACLPILAANNFQQYEVSAYSQADKHCVHNRNYWEFGDYLGIGAGAHSKITDINQQIAWRCYNTKNPRDYLNPNKEFIAEKKNIDVNEMPFEFMLNALRLYQPIDITLFEDRTGLAIDHIQDTLNLAQEKKLITFNKRQIEVTKLGRRFLDDLVGLFLAK